MIATLAGSGALGFADGPAASASFLLPAAVAYGPNGDLYVADAAAQRIRILVAATGMVRTLAGGGALDATGLWVPGAYRDGGGAEARFDRPEGIAVDRSGVAYVADRLNRCVRRIAPNGDVTTFAGSPAGGSADGTGRNASFSDPRAVAVDDDGNLYVADAGNGIRKITPQGAVTTLPWPLAATKAVVGIAVRGAGPKLTAAYTDGTTLHYLAGDIRHDANADHEIAPYAQNRRLGSTYALAIAGQNAVVTTDLSTNALAFVRFDDPPFFPALSRRSFAAGRVDGSLVTGGFRDGPGSSALLDDPLGIAPAPNGDFAVADGGNRRIRVLRGLDVRSYLRPDLTNIDLQPGDYRVVAIGDSYLDNDVMWNDSIAGIIASGLSAERTRLGFTQPTKVAYTSVSGASPSAQASFIENKFADGEADIVILFLDVVGLEHEFLERPAMQKDDRWKTAIPAMLRGLGAQLAKNRTAFEVVVIPEGPGVSPSERAQLGAANFPEERRRASDFEEAIASSGVRTVRLLAPMLDEERSPTHLILYNSLDHHLTIDGALFTGQQVLEDLKRWHPWGAPVAK